MYIFFYLLMQARAQTGLMQKAFSLLYAGFDKIVCKSLRGKIMVNIHAFQCEIFQPYFHSFIFIYVVCIKYEVMMRIPATFRLCVRYARGRMAASQAVLPALEPQMQIINRPQETCRAGLHPRGVGCFAAPSVSSAARG